VNAIFPEKPKPPSGGPGFRLLKPVEKIDGALCVRCSLDYGALVVPEHVEPGRDVRGVIVPDFRRQFQVSAEESRAELGHEFLAGIALIAPGFAPEIPVETVPVPRPVRVMPISA
jgi:hypothetical protein